MPPRNHAQQTHSRKSATTSRRSADNSFDIIVVGGGLAGLTTTCLLADAGLHVACIDREPPPATLQEVFDGRTTAISWGSRKVLEAAGIWHLINHVSCPIRQIDILDGDSPLLLSFNSEEVGGRTFGWIAENLAIRKALYQRVSQLEKAHHLAPALVKDYAVHDDHVEVQLGDDRRCQAQLVIGADGRQSFTRDWMGIGTRSWSYHQRALVCNVEHEYPHDNIAVEHFHPTGPFATLPLFDSDTGKHRSSVVWTEHGDDKDSALHWDQVSFDAGLTARFPARYGRVRQIGKRYSYPLGLIHAHDYIGPRMALVADAAHGIHPIAGQGLNLGFRDIAELCTLITQAYQQGNDPGAPELLAHYQRQRRLDNIGMAGATDGLTRLFSNDLTPVRLARRLGLRAVAKFPPAKQFFMKQAMGAAGLLPALIRDQAA